MTKTHTLKPGSTMNPIVIPHPDLIGLINKNLPGDVCVPVVLSLKGKLEFRIASLAGKVAMALASDSKKADPTIDTFNEAMSLIDCAQAAQFAFENAGLPRQDMISDLCAMFGYLHVVNDLLAAHVSREQLDMYAADWEQMVERASSERPPVQVDIDARYKRYVRDCVENDVEVIHGKEEYDSMSIVELAQPAALFAKYSAQVQAVIEAASYTEPHGFEKLALMTQLSLLSAFGEPAHDQAARLKLYDKVTITGKKRRQSQAVIDANCRLRMNFAKACHLATTHHRYATVGDAIVARVEPKVTTPKEIAADTKARIDKGVHADLIDQAVSAEKRATAANAIKVKADKAKAKAKPKVVKQEDLAKELALADQPNDL